MRRHREHGRRQEDHGGRAGGQGMRFSATLSQFISGFKSIANIFLLADEHDPILQSRASPQSRCFVWFSVRRSCYLLGCTVARVSAQQNSLQNITTEGWPRVYILDKTYVLGLRVVFQEFNTHANERGEGTCGRHFWSRNNEYVTDTQTTQHL